VSTLTCLQGRGDVSPVKVAVDSQKLAREPRRNCRALPLDEYTGTAMESAEAHAALLFPNYCSKPDGSSIMQMRAPQHVFELPCRGTEPPHYYSDARVSIREGSCLLLHADNDVPLNLQNLTIKGVLCTVL
jgi:hypothetical protein